MSSKHLIKILLLLILTPFIINGQKLHFLSKDLNTFTTSSIFKHANLSVSVVDIDADTTVVDHRGDKVLTPASSLKLITTLTALKKLGPKFQFTTKIGYTGRITDEGILEGDLVVVGGGDPTLGSGKIDGNPDLDEVTAQIVNSIISSDITCISGKILIDESIFDSYPIAPSWQWNDLGNYYASGAWGLNVNENQYYIYFKDRGQIGTRPTLQSTYPHIPNLDLSNEIIVDSSHTGDQAYVFGGPYNYQKRIVGTIPQGQSTFSIKGSIPDPPTFYASYLQKALTKANIQSEGINVRFRKDKKLKVNALDTIVSPDLSSIISVANRESNNLYTEAMLKMMGKQYNGQGSGQNGLASILKLMRDYGLDTKSVQLNDGSGLSARNLISTASIAYFLSNIAQDIGQENCINHIPRGGYQGTVRGMFSGSNAKGKIWIKSGSMQGVQSFSGYIQSKSGNWLSFSIIANGFSAKNSTVRRKMENFLTQIYKKT